MKAVITRCAMCPAEAGSSSYACPLFTPDLLTGQAYPCKFVRMYRDGARLVMVRLCPRRRRYKGFYQEKQGAAWTPLHTKYLAWCDHFDKAQLHLNLYEAKKRWVPVWPPEGDRI